MSVAPMSGDQERVVEIGIERTRRDTRRVGEGAVLLLSIEEAARTLGLGRSKTYELIAAGELEVVHIGRCARVPVDAVEAFVERLRQG